jgi:hypothetical protein
MPIMAASEWSDDRSTTLLMAEKVLECLQDQDKVQSAATVLNNVYRLLEAFKGNPFFGYVPEEPVESPDLDWASVAIEPHVPDVRYALEEALKAAFSGQQPETAIGVVENVLRALVAPDRFPVPKPAERERAVRFFSELSQRLAFA